MISGTDFVLSQTPQMQKLGHAKLAQQLQQNQQQQPNSGAKPVYTLPGVISYLTSEFTNLERFKIMANLEKSEMKHRILELQGEVNALTYVNRRQENRIRELEQEISRLKEISSQKDAIAGLKSDVSTSSEPQNESHNETQSQSPPAESPSAERLSSLSMNLSSSQFKQNIDDLPEIDLQAIKKLRNALAKSMKEILDLLKAPTARNVVPDPMGNPDSFMDNYDVLAVPREAVNSHAPSNRDLASGGTDAGVGVGSGPVLDSFVFNNLAAAESPSESAISMNGDVVGPPLNPKYESDSETVVMGNFNDSTEALSDKLNASSSSSSSTSEYRDNTHEIPLNLEGPVSPPSSPSRINEMAFIDYSNDNKFSNTRKFFHGAYVFILAYNESSVKVSIWSPSKLFSVEFEIENPDQIIDAYCLNPEDPNGDLILVYSGFGVRLTISNQAISKNVRFELDFEATKSDLLLLSNSEAQVEFLLLLSSDTKIKAFKIRQPEDQDTFSIKNIANLSCSDLGIGSIQEAHWLREAEEGDLSRTSRHSHNLADNEKEEDCMYKIIITGDSFIAKVDMFTYEVQTLTFDPVKSSAFVNEHQVIVTEDETILVDLAQFRITAKLDKTGPVFDVTALESNGHVYLVRLSDKGVLTIFDENLEDPQEIPVHRDSATISSIKGLIVLDSPQKSTLYVYDLPTLRFMYS